MRRGLPFLVTAGMASMLFAQSPDVDPAPPPLPPAPHPAPGSSLEKQGAPVIFTRILDAREVIAVPTSPGITTTLQFPGAVQGIDGVGLSAKAGEGVLYTLSHTTGTSILSLSPTSTEARTNMNVVVGGQVYVFVLAVNPDTALFKLTLENPPPPPRDPQDFPVPSERRESMVISPTRLLGLMDKCKAYAALQHDNPQNTEELTQGRGPWKSAVLDGAVVTPVEVYRKGAWDALVLRVSIKNTGASPLLYDPESLLVSAGPQSFSPLLVDASGKVPAGLQDDAWIVIQGDGAQGSNNLDTENEFQITFQKIEEGTGLPDAPSKSGSSPSSGK